MGEIGSTAYETWSKGVQGLSPEQIALGLRRCIDSGEKWPPSLPEFVALCRPTAEDMRLPHPYLAYREACEHVGDEAHAWSHPAVYVAARECGAYDLRRRPSNAMVPVFKRCYDIVCRRVLAGEALEVKIPKALPDQETVTPERTPAVRQSNIQQMKDALK